MNLTRPTHGDISDVAVVDFAAPVFISNPVFLNADPALL